MVPAMTPTHAPRLPPSTGWSWQVLRRDEFCLTWPLLSIVEGQDAEARLAEADAWIAGCDLRRGLVTVRCALGTITGLFFFAVEPAGAGDCLLVNRLTLVELFGPHRTLAALLRATRELGEIHACRTIRVLPPEHWVWPTVEGVAEVAQALGFTRGKHAWHLGFEAILH